MMLNLSKNNKYLLACSYGPDSMALFGMLINEGVLFDVAIVNYHLRKESNDEVNNLKIYCEKHNVSLFIKDVAYSLGNNNIEEKCRKIRYDFFNELNDKNHYAGTLIAHHKNDLLETYLLQKKRNNLVLHYGLLEKTFFGENLIIRPLLNYSKKDLLKYCKNNHIPYAIDSSNLTDVYQRNIIRHQIVEKLSNNEMDKIIDEINLKNFELENIFKTIDCLDISIINNLLKLDDLSFKYAINKLGRQFDKEIEISAKCCNEIKKAILSDKSNIAIPINKSTCVYKEYDKLRFGRVVNNFAYSFVVESPFVFDNKYFHFDFLKKDNLISENDFPITIKNVSSSESIKIKNYVVKVNRLFIDWKMPITYRKIWPGIYNNKGNLIYIPHYQKDFKISDNPNFYIKLDKFMN